MTEKTIEPVIALADLPLNRHDRGPGIGAHGANFSRAMGLTMLGASYFEVQPGESAFPFHVHYLEDEIIVILEGEGTYRFGEAADKVTVGDVLGAPAGRAELAHQLTNTGPGPLKYICVANQTDTNVVELPEHGVVRVHHRKAGGYDSIELNAPGKGQA
ncbi:putative cupin superfamily protein [Devosia subaequoris]|uniref:Putative cupin superfamily protein n=1 Tax=Devosia subaequoris TaxID=395930 RepID=A0A7W6IKG0_9HYPH|nr:cupin domain-containing protein [Devosia subaequoris]MBB4050661.1 putative cupin superfamily protein [Devosia subaequoris]MCP1208658.1 cupin domain-containing protein [Devosia subaequoris]